MLYTVTLEGCWRQPGWQVGGDVSGRQEGVQDYLLSESCPKNSFVLHYLFPFHGESIGIYKHQRKAGTAFSSEMAEGTVILSIFSVLMNACLCRSQKGVLGTKEVGGQVTGVH